MIGSGGGAELDEGFLLVGGLEAVGVPGAHADVCDLSVDTGRLASFGLPDGEGPGRQARCGIASCGACHSRRGVWSGSFVPWSLALLTGVVKRLVQSSRVHLLGS